MAYIINYYKDFLPKVINGSLKGSVKQEWKEATLNSDGKIAQQGDPNSIVWKGFISIHDIPLFNLRIDATTLGVYGKYWNDTENTYDRFTKRAKGVVRDEVWDLSKAPTGVHIRFKTDSPEIYVNYTLLGYATYLW